MHPIFQFVGEQVIDKAMPLNSRLTPHAFRNNKDPEMAFAGSRRVAVASVKLTLINDVQAKRLQARRKLLVNRSLDRHYDSFLSGVRQLRVERKVKPLMALLQRGEIARASELVQVCDQDHTPHA